MADSGRQRLRPIVGGLSASHRFSNSGTLGCLCRSIVAGSDSRPFVLSNCHVFAQSGHAARGDALLQPAPADRGTVADAFATLDRFVPLLDRAEGDNRVDAAIGVLLPGVEYRPLILDIGRIRGIKDGTVGMRVCKFGRSTGYTEGVVTALDATHDVHLSTANFSRKARFVDQIRIEPTPPYEQFATEGDSGSLVVDVASRKAVGLFFAAARNYTYALANPIALVCEELEIELL